MDAWTPITSVITNAHGNYHAAWFPLSTGSFQVQAAYAGNAAFQGTHDITQFSTISYHDEYVFSVQSNSTLSSLMFNTEAKTLSFDVSGPEGIHGYIKATVYKQVVETDQDITVYLNNSPVPFETLAFHDAWIVYCTYSPSTQHITIHLSDTLLIGAVFDNVFLIIAIFGAVSILAIIIAHRSK